jgi:hypothetical protein
MEPFVSSGEPKGPLVRYRNRAIDEKALAFIRSEVARHGEGTRTELAASLCAAWDWRQRNGSLGIFACKDLLKRLEEWGHIALPAARRRASRGAELPLVPAELVALPWVEVQGPGWSLESLEVRPIAPEERGGWRLFMGRYHYLGDKPVIGEHILYGAFLGGELVGLLAWAAAALHVPLREGFVGWDEATKRSNLHLVANNTRFLLLPWVRIKHLASKVLAANLRRLSADWRARWKHPLLLAETFVDVSRFKGTCYRASNWSYLGLSAGRSKHGNAYQYGGSRKAVFVFPLHRRARRLLCGPSKP